LLPFWDDLDKGTAHETVVFGEVDDAGWRPAGGGVRKPLRQQRLRPYFILPAFQYVSFALGVWLR